MTKAADLPKGSLAIFDTNIFVYFVTAHRDCGPSCKAIIQMVEKGEIEGGILTAVMNELFHKFFLVELINKGLALNREHAIARL